LNPYDFGGLSATTTWRTGMVSFVQQLRDKLNADGKYLVCNVSAFADPTLGSGDTGDGDANWSKMLSPNAVMTEGFAENRNTNPGALRSVGPNWYQHWDEWLAVPAKLAAAGINYIPLSYNNSGGYYTWASFLLIYQPPMSFTYPNDPNGTYIRNPGTPLEPRVNLNGVWRRRYSNFTVYVNPTTSTLAAEGHTLAPTSAVFV
jgi:hypothetical protein